MNNWPRLTKGIHAPTTRWHQPRQPHPSSSRVFERVWVPPCFVLLPPSRYSKERRRCEQQAWQEANFWVCRRRHGARRDCLHETRARSILLSSADLDAFGPAGTFGLVPLGALSRGAIRSKSDFSFCGCDCAFEFCADVEASKDRSITSSSFMARSEVAVSVASNTRRVQVITHFRQSLSHCIAFVLVPRQHLA